MGFLYSTCSFVASARFSMSLGFPPITKREGGDRHLRLHVGCLVNGPVDVLCVCVSVCLCAFVCVCVSLLRLLLRFPLKGSSAVAKPIQVRRKRKGGGGGREGVHVLFF